MKAKTSAIEDVIALVLLAVLMAISIAWPQTGIPILLGITSSMVVFATITLFQRRIGFLRWLVFALLAVALVFAALVPERWPATSHPVKIVWFAVLVICAAVSLVRWWRMDRRPR